VLLHVLDAAPFEPDRDPVRDLASSARSSPPRPGPARAPELVVLNKVDLPDGQAMAEMVRDELEAAGDEVFEVSAVSGAGARPAALPARGARPRAAAEAATTAEEPADEEVVLRLEPAGPTSRSPGRGRAYEVAASASSGGCRCCRSRSRTRSATCRGGCARRGRGGPDRRRGPRRATRSSSATWCSSSTPTRRPAPRSASAILAGEPRTEDEDVEDERRLGRVGRRRVDGDDEERTSREARFARPAWRSSRSARRACAAPTGGSTATRSVRSPSRSSVPARPAPSGARVVGRGRRRHGAARPRPAPDRPADPAGLRRGRAGRADPRVPAVFADHGLAAAQILLTQDDFVRRGPLPQRPDDAAAAAASSGRPGHQRERRGRHRGARLRRQRPPRRARGVDARRPAARAAVRRRRPLRPPSATRARAPTRSAWSTTSRTSTSPRSAGRARTSGPAGCAPRSSRPASRCVGAHAVVADARRPTSSTRSCSAGGRRDLVRGRPRRIEARRLWIGFALNRPRPGPRRRGRRAALVEGGTSLLASGHPRGRQLRRRRRRRGGRPDGRVIARGLNSNYDVADVRTAGRPHDAATRSDETLGAVTWFAREVIHRDDLRRAPRSS
jgi:hypothetical protein